jgi:hypothetical protein
MSNYFNHATGNTVPQTNDGLRPLYRSTGLSNGKPSSDFDVNDFHEDEASAPANDNLGGGWTRYAIFQMPSAPGASRCIAEMTSSANINYLYLNSLGYISSRINNTTIAGSVNLADGAPHHVCQVADQPNSMQYLYVDGVEVASGSVTVKDLVSNGGSLPEMHIGHVNSLVIPYWGASNGSDAYNSSLISLALAYFTAHSSTAQRGRVWEYIDKVYGI